MSMMGICPMCVMSPCMCGSNTRAGALAPKSNSPSSSVSLSLEEQRKRTQQDTIYFMGKNPK